MSTVTGTNLDNLTTGEAKIVLDKVISEIAHQDSEIIIAQDDLVIVSYAIENNLQIRDYLMGLANDGLSISSVTGILNVLAKLLHTAELPAYPVETVIAGYMYQLGNSEAPIMLINALERNYPLAKLIKKIFLAGWAPSALALMSKQLHPEIIEELTRTSELIVNENLR